MMRISTVVIWKRGVYVDTPFLRIEESGEVFPLRDVVTTVGRGQGADIRLDDPSVSRLHAELIRRGPYVYVVDLGLSRNGTRVNGRPVARRVLDEGDVLTSLCRPALSDEAFATPATAHEIATDLVVTEAAVKQHLLRLYQKFRISEGPNRRTRLANEVVALGLVRPIPLKPSSSSPSPSSSSSPSSDPGEGLSVGVLQQPVGR